MKDGFQKKFSNGDILALSDDYEGIDKGKYGVVCVVDTDKYVMFYVVTAVDGNGRIPMDFREVEKHYEKIGVCECAADELVFNGHVSFKR
jgi:hypothetical protein